MAIIALPSECPCCGREFAHLAPARWMIGDYPINVCDECNGRPLTEEELIRVAYYWGWHRGFSKAQEVLGKVEWPKTKELDIKPGLYHS